LDLRAVPSIHSPNHSIAKPPNLTAMPPPVPTNAIIDTFRAGGPVMWPILTVAVVATAVIIERAVWWWRQSAHRDVKRRQRVLLAVDQGDPATATQLAAESRDSVLHMIWHGLTHQHISLQGAMQVQAGEELERAARFLPVLDTTITLAPLLGLLGTVTGIMRAFRQVGSENELAVQAVSGGIGEALIATACGLAIAIGCLLPFNYYQRRVARLRFDLETNATNLELMLERAKGPKSS
jgi:biopolymer transport protein ExbB